MGKASRMKKERKGIGALNNWMSQVGSAVFDDDLEALKRFVQEDRHPILDIAVDMDDESKNLTLMQMASRVGAIRCLEHLCFLASAADNIQALNDVLTPLYSSYESDDGDIRELERLILAVLMGASKAETGPLPSIFLSLSVHFPKATRFAMIGMADHPCQSVAAPAYVRVHNENKRKAFAAMARGDVEAINALLCSTHSNLQANEDLIMGDEEVMRALQVAIACGRPESIVASFKTFRGLHDDLGRKGAVLALLMEGVDELTFTAQQARKPWLDQAVKDCAELAVIEDRELGETILKKADEVFDYSAEPAKSGAIAGLAEHERRELSSHVGMQEIIMRASSAVRI